MRRIQLAYLDHTYEEFELQGGVRVLSEEHPRVLQFMKAGEKTLVSVNLAVLHHWVETEDE